MDLLLEISQLEQMSTRFAHSCSLSKSRCSDIRVFILDGPSKTQITPTLHDRISSISSTRTLWSSPQLPILIVLLVSKCRSTQNKKPETSITSVWPGVKTSSTWGTLCCRRSCVNPFTPILYRQVFLLLFTFFSVSYLVRERAQVWSREASLSRRAVPLLFNTPSALHCMLTD